MRPACRGFTLTELLVVVALTAIISVAALDLMGEALHSLGRTAIGSTAPLTSAALAKLRTSIEQAVRVEQPSHEWTNETLRLRLADSDILSVGLTRGRLQEARSTSAGLPVASRILAGRFDRFRWRVLGERLIVVELAWTSAEPWRNRLADGRTGTATETALCWIELRGAGEARRW